MEKIFNPKSVKSDDCCSLTLQNKVRISNFTVVDGFGKTKDGTVYVRKCNKQKIEQLAKFLNETIKILHPLLNENDIKTEPFTQWYVNTNNERKVLSVKAECNLNSKKVNIEDFNFFIGADAKRNAQIMVMVIKAILNFCVTFI